MKLEPAQWRALSVLLDEALELEPTGRRAWLDALSGEARGFQPMLADLLVRTEAGAEMFLDTLPRIAAPDRTPAFFAGGRVGPYRLLRRLGRGGMGEVWLSERADGVLKRPVALKLPLLATNPDILAERFAREREILASLAHAHIARLYDAGFDIEGQPYLALEYIDGIPLTHYADVHRLGVLARLRLFDQVLDAVAHAHASLVLHRDLKPSNILVTPAGDVKLLDFGIAKLLQSGAAEDSALTRISGQALTPDYASPEQITGGPLTTAADVYGLGVVLYELLTGKRPYRLKRGSPAELEEAIAFVDPAAPSRARIVDAAAAQRATTVHRLRRTLSGDLDTIVLKALRKRPDERYAGARALAEDLERYRDGAPVLARPTSVSYRTAKWMKRHRAGVALGSVVAATLLGATGIALHQARVASIEAQRAEASNDFLMGLFQHAARNNPGGAAAADTTLRQLLAIGSRKVLDDSRASPELQLDVSALLARLNLEVDLVDTAERLTERSLVLARKLHGENSLPVAQVLAQHADNLYRSGRYAEAIEASRQVLAHVDRARAPADELRARAHILIGNSMFQVDASKTAEPLQHLETALELLKRAHATTEDRSRAAYFIGWIHESTGDFARAETYYNDGIEAGRANFGERSFIVAFGYEGLAESLRRQRRLAEARDTMGRAIDIYQYVLAPRHATVAFARTSLSMIEASSGRLAEAERLADDALAVTKTVFGEHARQTVVPATQAARLKVQRGELESGLALYEDALAALVAEDRSSLTNRALRIEYAEALLETGEIGKARTALDEAQAGFEAAHDLASVRGAWLRLVRGELAVAAGDSDAASAFDHVLDSFTRSDQGAPALARRAANATARYSPTPERAETMLQKLPEFGLLPTSPDELDIDIVDKAQLADSIGRLFNVAGKRPEAFAWLSKAVALREQLEVPESPRLRDARLALTRAGSVNERR
ncbi:MAG TPA: serine/threonine-protein kinase [Casimicrobiaceae bacterium]|nr:serine/threonine-protein kinase [Casimicrobiaceae bacterium]